MTSYDFVRSHTKSYEGETMRRRHFIPCERHRAALVWLSMTVRAKRGRDFIWLRMTSLEVIWSRMKARQCVADIYSFVRATASCISMTGMTVRAKRERDFIWLGMTSYDLTSYDFIWLDSIWLRLTLYELTLYDLTSYNLVWDFIWASWLHFILLNFVRLSTSFLRQRQRLC